MTIGKNRFFNFAQKNTKEIKMKSLNIKILALIIYFLPNSLIYSQSAKSEIYHTDLFSIVYINGINDTISSGKSMNSGYNKRLVINNIYKVTFTNDTLINVSSELKSKTEIKIRNIEMVIFTKSSVNIGAWIGLVAGAILGGYYAGESVPPGIGRVFSAIGGALVGGFIGGSILGAVSPPSNYSDSFFIGKYNRDKKTELQRILRENSSR